MRRIRSIFVTLVALYMTFLAGTPFTNVLLWPRVIQTAIFVLLFGGWLLSLIVRRRPFPATPIDLPILAYLSVYLLGALFAVDPRVSLESMWLMGAHALLFYMFVDLMHTYPPETIIKPLVFTLSVVILVSLIGEITWYLGIGLFHLGWPEIGGLSNPLPPVILRQGIGPLAVQSVSDLMATWIPVMLAWAIATQHRQVRQMAILWLFGAAAVIVITFSRGAFLSLAVSLLSLAFLYLTGSSRWRERIAGWLSDWRGRVILIVLAIAVMTGIGLGAVRLGALRAQVTGGGYQSGDTVRLDLWRSAWEIGLERPLLGSGLSSFGRQLRTVRNSLITGDYLVVPDNYPLLVWAEAGGAGILAMLWLVTSTAWLAYNRWREADGVQRIRIAGVCAGLIGFAAHNAVDLFAFTPCLFSAFGLAAFLIAPAPPNARSAAIRKAMPYVLGGLLLASLPLLAISYRAYYFATKANDYEAAGDFHLAVQAIDTARSIDPAMGLYDAQRARYLGMMVQWGDGDLVQALAAYKSAFSREDSYDVMYAHQAVLLQIADAQNAAQEAMERALELYPADRRYYLWAGEYAEHNGDEAGATRHYQAALEEIPYWATSTFWQETPLRASVVEAFLEERQLDKIPLDELRAIPGECWPTLLDETSNATFDGQYLCDARIALSIEDNPAKALDLLAQVQWQTGSDLYYLRAEAAHAMGDLAEAKQAAQTALFLDDRRGNLVLGRIAEEQGDIVSAANAYLSSMPVHETRQAWSYAVYGRKDAFYLPPSLGAPSFGPDELAPALALMRMYTAQGDEMSADAIDSMMRQYDPYFSPYP